MIRKKERELTPYEKYFMEAPARRPYMRIISAFPDGRLKRFDTNMELPPEDDETDTPENNADLDLVDDTDFSANIGTDEPDEPIAQDDGGLETEPPADAAEPVPENDPQEADAQTDVPAEEPVEPTDQPTEGDTAETPDNPDEGLETEPPADTGTDAPTDDDTDAVGGGEGELAADDNTDFSANIDADDAGDEGGGEDVEADDTEDGTSQTGQTNNTENQLKFSLYRNLKNLYITIQNYESQLDEMVASSYNFNMVIKSASNKMANLEDLMYDYMTLRFKDATYIESMEFYQKCLATLELIFELLRSNKENANFKDKTIN